MPSSTDLPAIDTPSEGPDPLDDPPRPDSRRQKYERQLDVELGHSMAESAGVYQDIGDALVALGRLEEAATVYAEQYAHLLVAREHYSKTDRDNDTGVRIEMFEDRFDITGGTATPDAIRSALERNAQHASLMTAIARLAREDSDERMKDVVRELSALHSDRKNSYRIDAADLLGRPDSWLSRLLRGTLHRELVPTFKNRVREALGTMKIK